MNSFEKEVRKALVDKELNISKLSQQLGITPAYLYDILKGNRPGTKQKKKIIEILGMKEEVN